MNTETGAVQEFASEEEAKAAGHTLTVTPDAAELIVGLSPVARAQAMPRFRAIELAGLKVVDALAVAAITGPRSRWRAYLSKVRRDVRKGRK